MTRELRLENVSAFYGASQILHGVNLSVARGTVACLLGLNGMGKTTTLRAIMGLVDRVEGRLTLDGAELVGRTYVRSRQGVTLVPEDRKVFPNLTVQENMEVAKRSSGTGREFQFDDATALFPRLKERLSQRGGTLSGGEQQMLVVARALLANPSYMLLDEPTEGLAPGYVDAIKDSVLAARERDIGVVLVEQSLPLALAVGDHFHVMENGQIVFSADRAQVSADPSILEKKLLVE
jgi:ABC-type branched-subunit amino acid transport system ATPase component